jgi:hypothetical protein
MGHALFAVNVVTLPNIAHHQKHESIPARFFLPEKIPILHFSLPDFCFVFDRFLGAFIGHVVPIFTTVVWRE